MTAALTILFLACMVAVLYGFFLMLFKKGRRKRGLKLSLGSILALFVVMVTLGWNLQHNDATEKAADLGFDTAADMRAAEAEGITDPAAWVEFKAEREREAERAEQERLAAEAREEQERLAAEAEEEQEKRRKGFHCLSSWDGSHRAFKRAVRDSMRNPSSFEHIETRITPVDENGQHTLLIKYRAENGFGGMSVGEAMALIDNETCNATPLSID